MKLAAIIVSVLAGGTFVAAIRLLIATYEFAHGNQYAMGQFRSLTYSAWPVEADGSAIYAPALLLLGIALFLARFAYNLGQPRERN